MLTGLLINAGEAPVKNIGDYIQTIAQMQFLNKYDLLIERENLNKIANKEKIRLIMNGWFMRHPENFPPSDAIDPLFVSFHVSPKIENEFFKPNVIDYLKQYSPIGCRDFGTVEIMKKHGINAYFSGCLTLTLGLTYKRSSDAMSTVFVDPYYEYGCGKTGILKHIFSAYLTLRYFNKIRKFIKNFNPEFIEAPYKISPLYNKYALAACFYHTYRNCFSDELILNAKFINHQVNQSDFNNEDEKINYADSLLRLYSSSQLVVTSRIHCALPCLGIGTPVIFVASENLNQGKLRSSGRFGGLINLLNAVYWTPKGIIDKGVNLITQKIDTKNIPDNSSDYLELRDSLIRDVTTFLNKKK